MPDDTRINDSSTVGYGTLDTIEQRMLQDRLDAARECAVRARAAHIVITIASLALLVALWNAYLSWYGRFARAAVEKAQAAELQSGRRDQVTQSNDIRSKINEDILAKWIETQWVSVGPLGIHVGVSDLGVWGSVGLAVISIWFFLAIRRENHVVGRLISDVWNDPPNVRRYVFHGIVSRQIFVTVTGEDIPIGEIMPAPPIRAENHKEGGEKEAEADAQDRKRQSPVQRLSQFFVRQGVTILHNFPPFTVACIFAADLSSLLGRAEYRGQEVSLWHTLSRGDKTQAVMMLLFSRLCVIGLSLVSYAIGAFRRATTQMMRAFWKDILQKERSGATGNPEA